MGTTSNYGLYITDDLSEGFGQWREKMNGTASSNMTKIDAALGEKLDASLAGAAGGVATLEAGGKIPASQLPSFVDDVIEYDALSDFPENGENGKIYIAVDTNITYRWGGTNYVPIGSDLALGETPLTAYYGDKGKAAYDHSQAAHAPADAQKNVQSDWNATSGDAAILNKPDIDDVPTDGSDNMISSGAVYEALQGVTQVHYGADEPENGESLWINVDGDADDVYTKGEVDAIALGKQDKLIGETGQFVGFDAEGNAVAVSAPTGVILDSIYITHSPDKTEYKAGEVFDTSGMEVKASYTNGVVVIVRDIVVTGWNVSPSGALYAEDGFVTVQYTENGVTKTAQQAISVTKTIVQIPSQSRELTYNEDPQYPTWVNTEHIIFSGALSGVNAGNYTANAALDNTALYCWSDNTIEDKTLTWAIAKAQGVITLSSSTITLNPDLTNGTFSVAKNVSGSISVNNSDPAICSAEVSGDTVSVASVGGKSGYATITVSASGDENHTTPESVTCTVHCAFVSIYGVQWDGTSTTVWSRTDDAALFSNPVPYAAGASYGSPFDGKLPWSGMVRVTDSVAGELVAIPKYWYKWTKNGNTLKLQIADYPADGFYVSPAHADRGDGKGERDTVYVGRYHCHTSNYKSQTGGNPKVSIARSSARNSIHSLGSDVWQWDWAMNWTIKMLYLVEFADWNSQKTIGKGCGNNSNVQVMGYTDSMPYHTGTTQSSRDTYGCGTQYRYIEGLWDNAFDFVDGCYYNSNGLNIISNPANFSDSSNGICVSTVKNGWSSAFAVSTMCGQQWLRPTATSGSETTYMSDCWYFNASGSCLYVGGYFGQGGYYGLFYVHCSAASSTSASVGCRLMKLP